MRTSRCFYLLLLVSMVLPFSIAAQLSGEYTVGSGGYFPTLTNAVDSLNLQGISSSVKFKIKSDTYGERVTINAFSGASETDTVVFTSETGNREDVTISVDAPDSLNNFLIKLKGCERVTVKNISFLTASSLLSTHVFITNGASHNRIENCSFTASNVVTSGVDSATVINSYYSGEKEEFNEIIGNRIFGGALGISLAGEMPLVEEGNVIEKNEFEGQVDNAMSVVFQKNFGIKNNSIDHQSGVSAVLIGRTEGRGFITGNKVYTTENYAFNVSYHNDAGLTDSLFITNNMMSSPNGTPLLCYYSKGVHIIHNTLYNASHLFRTLAINDIEESNIQNNLLVNNNNYEIIQLVNVGANVDCNFNGFSNLSGTIGTSDRGIEASFADWQTSPGSPGASSVFNGSFAFRNLDYDLTPFCGMPDEFRTTNYSDKLSHDVNGKRRSSTEPWMGAAELRLPDYHTADFEGYVTDGTDTLKSGTIKVYADKSSDAIFDELTSVSIDGSGFYEVNSVEYADEYWLKIIPSDPSFITSYHRGTLRWDDSLAFKLSDSCDAYVKDIVPRKLEGIGSGGYSLSGTITETGGTGKTFGTDPIPGLDVVLDRIPPSKTVAFTTTDENGYYYFGDLPEGTYVVTIDYEGLHSDTLYEVKLNSDTTEIEDLDYCVDFGDRIRGCSPEIESAEEIFRDLTVYPNPVNGTLFLEGILGEYSAFITDINGRVIFINQGIQGNTSIETENLIPGVYLLTISKNGEQQTIKVVK